MGATSGGETDIGRGQGGYRGKRTRGYRGKRTRELGKRTGIHRIPVEPEWGQGHGKIRRWGKFSVQEAFPHSLTVGAYNWKR